MNNMSTSTQTSRTDLNTQLEAAVHSRDLDKLTELLNRGADPAARHGKAFFIAASSNFSEGAKLLFERHKGKDSPFSSLLDSAFNQLTKHHDPLSETGKMLISWGARAQVNTLLERFIGEEYLPGVAFLSEYCEDKNICEKALLSAVEHGDLLTVQTLVEKETDLTTEDNYAVRIAAARGHLEIVKLLCAKGANVKARNNEAICQASSNGHVDVVQYLVERGASVTANNNAPICVAALYGHLPVVRFLLESGAIASADDNGAVKSALQSGHIEVAHILFAHGADVASTDSVIIQAARKGRLDVVKLLCARGADIAALGDRAIRAAAESGHLDVVQFLIERGANPRENDSASLSKAAKAGHLNVVKFLWEVGADPTHKKNEALCDAATNGHLDIVEFLCEVGTDVTCKGNYPLSVAAENGHFEVVEVLCRYGAGVADRDNRIIKQAINTIDNVFGVTKETGARLFEVIKILSEYGADVTVEGNKAVHIAAKHGRLDVVKVLHAHGADLTAENNKPIILAAAENHHEVVRYLCENGADVAARDNAPICIAAEKGHLDVLRILCEYGADVSARNNGPIRIAADYDKGEVVKFLCKEYANSDLPHFNTVLSYFWLLPAESRLLLLQQFKSHFLRQNKLSQRLRDALCYKALDNRPYFDRLIEVCVDIASCLCGKTPERAGEIAERLFRKQLAAFEGMAERDSRLSFSDTFERLITDGDKLSNLSDVIGQVATVIILPKLVQQSELRDVDQLLRRAYSFALDSILADRDLRKLIQLNRFMHSSIATLPAHLRPFISDIAWPPLFKESIELPSEFSIVALSNQNELVAEGAALAHCVGDGQRATQCSSGKKQILSLRKNGERLATIELSQTSDSHLFSSSRNRTWCLSEFKEYKNSRPSPESQAAFNTFVELAKNNQITFNPLVEWFDGASMEDFNGFISPLERITGIPDDEPELLEEIAKHYLMLAEKFGEPIFYIPRDEQLCESFPPPPISETLDDEWDDESTILF